MRKFGYLLLAVVTFVNFSCSDKCSDAEPPSFPSLFVTITDSDDEQNVFNNGRFSEDQIVITLPNEQEVPFRFLSNSNILHVVPIRTLEEGNVIFLTLNNTETDDVVIVELQFDIEIQNEECFTLRKVKNIQSPTHEIVFIGSSVDIKI
jgi:hypothetical protein